MVTKEDLKNLSLSPDEYYSSKYTTPEEMTRFEKAENDLRYMLMKLIKDYQENRGYKSNTKALEMFAEECRTSETTLKKCMNGSQTISRKLLYKLSVGLKMSQEEANQYFSLCGGTLRESDPIDYICINAIKDKDDIDLFIEQVTGSLFISEKTLVRKVNFSVFKFFPLTPGYVLRYVPAFFLSQRGHLFEFEFLHAKPQAALLPFTP